MQFGSQNALVDVLSAAGGEGAAGRAAGVTSSTWLMVGRGDGRGQSKGDRAAVGVRGGYGGGLTGRFRHGRQFCNGFSSTIRELRTLGFRHSVGGGAITAQPCGRWFHLRTGWVLASQDFIIFVFQAAIRLHVMSVIKAEAIAMVIGVAAVDFRGY